MCVCVNWNFEIVLFKMIYFLYICFNSFWEGCVKISCLVIGICQFFSNSSVKLFQLSDPQFLCMMKWEIVYKTSIGIVGTKSARAVLAWLLLLLYTISVNLRAALSRWLSFGQWGTSARMESKQGILNPVDQSISPRLGQWQLEVISFTRRNCFF